MPELEPDFIVDPPTCRFRLSSNIGAVVPYGTPSKDYIFTEREFDDTYPGGDYYAWCVTSKQGDYLHTVLDKELSQSFGSAVRSALAPLL